MESALPYVFAILPTIGVATLFYFIMKSILEGDRRERLAQARWEAEHDRRRTEPGQASSPDSARASRPAPASETTPTTPNTPTTPPAEH